MAEVLESELKSVKAQMESIEPSLLKEREINSELRKERDYLLQEREMRGTSSPQSSENPTAYPSTPSVPSKASLAFASPAITVAREKDARKLHTEIVREVSFLHFPFLLLNIIYVLSQPTS